MNLIERAKNVCVTPATEWPVIAKEETSARSLVTDYVVPLAGVSALAGFVGGSIVGRTAPFIGTVRVPIFTGFAAAIVTVVVAVVGVLAMGAIINALAPTFDGRKDSAQSLKIAVYSFTPAWVAGVLQIIPALSALAVLGGLYGIYLLYLGLPQLMQSPADKTVGYTAAVVVCGLVLAVVLGGVAALVTGAGAIGAGILGGGVTGTATEVEADGALGQLQQLAEALEESAQRAEEAAARGDQTGQAAAALEGFTALVGGGTRVDPIDIDQLRALVPEVFAGLPRGRTASSV